MACGPPINYEKWLPVDHGARCATYINYINLNFEP